MLISDHSNGAEKVFKSINDSNCFNESHLICTSVFFKKKHLLNSIKKYLEICLYAQNEYSRIILKDVSPEPFDEIISHNIRRDSVSVFTALSKHNKNIILSRYEEGILSYNNTIQKIITPKRRIMDFVRRIQGKPEFTKSGRYFYCFYPELYKGELTPVKVPLISETPETIEIIKKVFNVNLGDNDYKEKYIFFTSVYDFEGEHPIGEYELACRIADLVGKDNLLIKTHPRDRRTIYADNGFRVDKNSNIPWEAIQLSGDFGDKVFLTATSGSVLSGSFMSSNPPKTFYLYKLCDIDGNLLAEESRKSIDELLNNSEMQAVFSRVKAANTIEEILG